MKAPLPSGNSCQKIFIGHPDNYLFPIGKVLYLQVDIAKRVLAMPSRLIVPAVTLLLAFFGTAYAKGPHGSIRVGQWTGGAYTNDATGAFSHCAAGVSYQSGIYLTVGLFANHEWRLGFVHPDWHLTIGETIPITLTFDGREQFNVFGIAQTPLFVLVPMPQNSTLSMQFRKSNGMTALAKGNAFQFALTSTSQLMPTLANCVDRMKHGGIRAAGDFSITAAPPVPAQPAPIEASGSLKPDVSQEYQIEAMEIATNFILKSALQNPRILSRSEIPATLVSNGAAWKSEEAFGSVRIMPEGGGTKGIDVASAIAAADAKECKGKFATGREAKLVNSDVVFHGFAVCEDTDGSRSAQYFVVPRKKGGFIVFSLVSDMKTEKSRGAVKEEKLVDFQKAALISADA
ncbi:MAG: hypothetical protein WA791_10150, partial [Rhodomicrobium sp.]